MSGILLYELLPEKNKVDIPIPIERFFKSGGITEAEKERFSRYYISAMLKYVFREKDGDFEGIAEPRNEELHILEIQIRTRSMGRYDLSRFAIAVKQGYPNNLLLVLRYQDAYCFYAFVSHINSRNQNKDVVNKLRGSGWITANTEHHYLDSEEERKISNYSDYRAINERIRDRIFKGRSMEQMMQNLCKTLEEDKSMWTRFYHNSMQYGRSCVAEGFALYCDEEELFKDGDDDIFSVRTEGNSEEDEDDYGELDEKYYDPFGEDE